MIIGLSSIPSRSFPDVSILSMDKLIHGVEYWGFAVLLTLGLTKIDVKIIALLIAFGIVFGACDEMYQSFIPGRDVDVQDWLADVFGFGIGVISGIFVNRKR